MIISKILAAVTVLVMLGIGGCQSGTDYARKASIQPQTPAMTGKPLISENGLTRLTLPEGWGAQTEENQMFSLAIASPTEDAYITLHTHPKDQLVHRNLAQIAEFNRQASSTTFSELEVSPTDVALVNGYPAVQYEVRGSVDNVKIVLLMTTVETPNHFHQLVAGTSQFSYERYQETLQNIIQSLHDSEPTES